MTTNFAPLSLTKTTNNMDYEKLAQRCTAGFSVIITSACNGEIAIYIHDWVTAKQALEDHDSWVKHFKELNEKFPEINQTYKIVVKRVLVFGCIPNANHALSDLTIEQLTELAK